MCGPEGGCRRGDGASRAAAIVAHRLPANPAAAAAGLCPALPRAIWEEHATPACVYAFCTLYKTFSLCHNQGKQPVASHRHTTSARCCCPYSHAAVTRQLTNCLPAPCLSCPPPQKTDQLCRNPKPCSYGDRCIFAHNMEEQKRFRQAYGFGGSGGQGGNQVGASN